MRGTRAKRIRRAARAATTGMPDRDYKEQRFPKWFVFRGKKVEFFVVTRRLSEGCTRHVYRAMKRSRPWT